MHIGFSPTDLAFQTEVRKILAERLTPDLTCDPDDLAHAQAQSRAWHRITATLGWAAPSWPVPYGGPDWSATQRYIWREEQARAGAPNPMPFGTNMVGPILYTFGSKEQKARFLPGIVSGDQQWCQGYSEPGAGSDLAQLRTAAVRADDHYVVNGHKTWTSLAQFADWGFFLVRTDPQASRPQNGISVLLIDMKSPGVTVRPIQLIDGTPHVCDVFLDNVRVPLDNRVGEENAGWTYGKVLLAHERSGIANIAKSKARLENLLALASTLPGIEGRRLADDTGFRRKAAELWIDLTALESTELRVLAAEQAGDAPGPESSLLKIKGTEIQQRLGELGAECLGEDLAMEFNGLAPEYLFGRASSIYGGSNEIQRNIIAKQVLRL